MISFIKLIRLPNLLIIALTQYLVRYAIIERYISKAELELQFSDKHFFLLSLSTVMIAAAGYIINDYFDIKIDRINKPESLIVGNTIKRRVAMGSHVVINIIAIGIAWYLATLVVGIQGLVMIHVLIGTGLWFYATTFKQQFLIGNIIIAIMTAAVPLVAGLYEIAVLNAIYWKEILNEGIYFNDLFKLIGLYALFAGLTTLIREIVKDMEDYVGDMQYQSKTMPIVIGMQKTKWVLLGIIALLMSLIAYVVFLEYQTGMTTAIMYFIGLIEVPAIVMIFLLMRAESKKQYTNISLLLKGIIITGICSMFII
ncbi:MAG: geranylgeranylglycerol-phosphate geranylgeranyltransferase [Bacteroidetes bacterium]|nr:geranylgeranylglycerol-phosphate geranylgeranyltransferase [Bacteroidota bacterium]